MDLTFRDIFYPLYSPINFHRVATGKIVVKFPHVVNLSVERFRKTCNRKSISAWEGEGMDTGIICTEDGKANRKGKTWNSNVLAINASLPEFEGNEKKKQIKKTVQITVAWIAKDIVFSLE